MPYRKGYPRRRNGRRNYRSARRNYRRGGSRRSVAMRSFMNRKALSYRFGGFTGIEKKFVDQVRSVDVPATWAFAQSVDPTGTLCLNAVAQGTGQNQRIGRQYTIWSITIHGRLEVFFTDPMAADVLSEDVNIRLALVHDLQTNGAQLNGGTVFDETAGLSINAFRNLEFVQRYRVLKEKQMKFRQVDAILHVSGAPSSLTSASVRLFKLRYVFKKPLVVTTSDVGDTIADITDNSLHLLAIDDAPGASAQAVLSYSSRLRYTG